MGVCCIIPQTIFSKVLKHSPKRMLNLTTPTKKFPQIAGEI